MVTWVDIAIVVLMVAIVVLELKRGFGRALFDLVAVVVAMRLAYILVNPENGVFKVAAGTPAHVGFAYLMVFGVISIVLLFVGHMIYSNLLFSADTFEAMLGGFFGFFVGLTICHVLVTSLNMMAGSDAATNLVTHSGLAPEFLEFTTYHRVMDYLYNFNK